MELIFRKIFMQDYKYMYFHYSVNDHISLKKKKEEKPKPLIMGFLFGTDPNFLTDLKMPIVLA